MTGYSHHKCSALEFTEEIFMFFYHWGLTLIRLVGIMLETIMINPRSMKTIPMWKVVTQESDLSGGARTWCSSSSSSVPTLATLCRFVQMMDCPPPRHAPGHAHPALPPDLAEPPLVPFLPLHPHRHRALNGRGQWHLLCSSLLTPQGSGLAWGFMLGLTCVSFE